MFRYLEETCKTDQPTLPVKSSMLHILQLKFYVSKIMFYYKSLQKKDENCENDFGFIMSLPDTDSFVEQHHL